MLITGDLKPSQIYRQPVHCRTKFHFLPWNRLLEILRFILISDYEKEIEIMQNLTKEEYLTSLRRISTLYVKLKCLKALTACGTRLSRDTILRGRTDDGVLMIANSQ
ncbi:hypothetical protein PTKIN_Ptkin15bG0097900 [Pterospermum kingtungense]